MKSKLFVVPVLIALVTSPFASVFAQTETPKSSPKNTSLLGLPEKDNKGEGMGDAKNFCANLTKIEAKVLTKQADIFDKREGKKTEKESEFEAKKSEHETKVATTRAARDAQFAARVAEMKTKMTKVSPATIDDFQNQMMAAIGEHRAQIDAEMQSFSKELGDAKLTKSAAFVAAMDTLKADVATAITKAKDSCAQPSADSVKIATTFKADMKAAHDKFKAVRATLKDGEVKQIREEHKGNVEEIHTESKTKFEGIRDFFASLFGKKDKKQEDSQ